MRQVLSPDTLKKEAIYPEMIELFLIKKNVCQNYMTLLFFSVFFNKVIEFGHILITDIIINFFTQQAE